jgi:transcriptional regulator with XRE-family HTH domain
LSEISTPDPVDVHVGRMLRAHRKRMSLSQQGLADACKVTFQQVQKYERGANRVSASMLQRAADCLGIHPGDFFPEQAASGVGLGAPHDLAQTAGGYELAAAYLELDVVRRRSLLVIARALIATMAADPAAGLEHAPPSREPARVAHA